MDEAGESSALDDGSVVDVFTDDSDRVDFEENTLAVVVCPSICALEAFDLCSCKAMVLCRVEDFAFCTNAVANPAMLLWATLDDIPVIVDERTTKVAIRPKRDANKCPECRFLLLLLLLVSTAIYETTAPIRWFFVKLFD